MTDSVDLAWLPLTATAVLGAGAVLLDGTGVLVDTVAGELDAALEQHGGRRVTDGTEADTWLLTTERAAHYSSVAAVADAVAAVPGDLNPDGFVLLRRPGQQVVIGGSDSGLLYGVFALLRPPAPGEPEVTVHAPTYRLRMLDHWDNMTAHPKMGTVKRGYAGDSLFFHEGEVREDLGRVDSYARLLASIGINRVVINNVNVHERESLLITDQLPGAARIADVLRPWGIRLHLAVNFAAPISVGGLPTADPLDPSVANWWAEATAGVYAAIPDFGGYLVKADSEGQPGPFAYGRDHADGANLLATALAPFGGLVHWRAFVYNHTQDWRDRNTDRARAAYDHFAPLDGRFADNVIVQIKHGPMDFQVREPVSPLLAALPGTEVAVELQITQEYTGQQHHVCYLGRSWSQVLRFGLADEGRRSVADLVNGLVAVPNTGTDEFWTGHPLAQANLYAFGALAWDPTADPDRVLADWAGLTFADPEVAATVVELMADSWETHESYTAPLGVGFMVRPHFHYGPDVDGYEYTPWGTYHFADRDGIGVDRTRATGTGYTGQYALPWQDIYEDLATCPDELLLFFHHVPYAHRLQSGTTVIQHISDTHYEGVDRVQEIVSTWSGLQGRVDEPVFQRVSERLAEQLRSAIEWRDQLCTYFWRKSGIADERGRALYR